MHTHTPFYSTLDVNTSTNFVRQWTCYGLDQTLASLVINCIKKWHQWNFPHIPRLLICISNMSYLNCKSVTAKRKIPAIVMDGASCSYSPMTPLGHFLPLFSAFHSAKRKIINDSVLMFSTKRFTLNWFVVKTNTQD